MISGASADAPDPSGLERLSRNHKQATDTSGSQRLAPDRLGQLAVVLTSRCTWVAREQLVAPLLRDLSEEMGRRNLRKLTFRARQHAWMSGLEADNAALR